jgi:cobalt-zinc-cadmium efflux system outer membrane protein
LRVWRAGSAFVAGCLFAGTAFTQPAPPAASTPASAPIRDLLRDPAALTAWLATHSPDAAAAGARVAQAQAAYAGSRLRPNPQLSATFGGIPAGTTNPPGLGWGETVNYGATISQAFEIGKRAPRSSAARFRLTAEAQAAAGAMLGSVGDARAAMARVLYARSRRAALADSLDLARQVVALQRVRFERGDLSGIDFDRLQLDAQMLDADLAQATADLTDSLGACADLLFAPCDPGDAALDIVSALIAPPDSVLPPDWDATLRARPDLQSLEAQQQAAAQDAVLAAKRRVPDPIVSLGYTRDRFLISGDNPRTLSVGVTIPLPAFDRGQHDAARALASERELHQTALAVTARARSDAGALRERQQALAASLATLQADALARADGILSATSDAVSQGELSTTDLLLARRARTDVALKVMDLQLQLFLVQNDLRQVLGLDAPDVRRMQGVSWPTP